MSSTNALLKRRANMPPEQQHAGLIVFVGRIMAICFAFTIMAFIYGILFVDQPMEQAPTDAQLIDLLVHVACISYRLTVGTFSI
jgi:hypothetical protein